MSLRSSGLRNTTLVREVKADVKPTRLARGSVSTD